jgi:hypothetical protein
VNTVGANDFHVFFNLGHAGLLALRAKQLARPKFLGLVCQRTGDAALGFREAGARGFLITQSRNAGAFQPRSGRLFSPVGT